MLFTPDSRLAAGESFNFLQIGTNLQRALVFERVGRTSRFIPESRFHSQRTGDNDPTFPFPLGRLHFVSSLHQWNGTFLLAERRWPLSRCQFCVTLQHRDIPPFISSRNSEQARSSYAYVGLIQAHSRPVPFSSLAGSDSQEIGRAHV